MEENTNTFRDKVADLLKQDQFDEVLALLSDDVLEREKDAELYLWRGNAWYNKADYIKAIADYSKATELNPKYELAFYNRGLAYVAIKEFDRAIEDYTKGISFMPNYVDAYYTDRGNAWKAKKEYEKAIDDYNKAIEINPAFENAFYNRGLAKKENNVDLEGSIKDFEKYLTLSIHKDEPWAKYAKYYIEDLNERINDKELSVVADVIADLISKIKGILLIEEDCITHYTSISALNNLILDCGKFRISEGNFMNDPSEGMELYNFLFDKTSASSIDGSSAVCFSPKPFIGSFVAKDKCDDLNMWRFYGKENGVEAKGCAITLCMQKFIENIKDSLSNEKNKEARLLDESDINFYQVVYVSHNCSTNFYIPNSDKSEELGKLMEELKEKVNSYNGNNKAYLEKYLNSIAFLFKRDDYKNENEVRLVVKGIEFEKKYNMDVSPPRVYIDLESIKNKVIQITLGPKVENVNEWASAIYYSYDDKAPDIMISHLPYK